MSRRDTGPVSFLAVPLKNHEGDVIGVLQLLNAKEPGTDRVVPFQEDTQKLIEALASQAAISLENKLLLKAQRDLLDAFIELIAGAIDAKSAYTGGHCQRVPELTNLLARARPTSPTTLISISVSMKTVGTNFTSLVGCMTAERSPRPNIS